MELYLLTVFGVIALFFFLVALERRLYPKGRVTPPKARPTTPEVKPPVKAPVTPLPQPQSQSGGELAYWARRLFSFSGEAGRSEFFVVWGAYLFVQFITILIGSVIASEFGQGQTPESFTIIMLACPTLFFIVGLIMIIAVIIRRLHDLGRPGWYILWALIPFSSLILLLYLLFAPGQEYPQDT